MKKFEIGDEVITESGKIYTVASVGEDDTDDIVVLEDENGNLENFMIGEFWHVEKPIN